MEAISGLLNALVYPLGQVFLLALGGFALLCLKRCRAGLVCLVVSLSWLYLCSTALFANYLMAILERDFTPRAMSVIEPAQAIVLLGGAMRGDVHLGTLPDLNQQADRLVQAVALYRAGKAPLLLLSGGGYPEDRSEAAQMQDLLQVMGVPAAAMSLEQDSRTTYDNARYSAQWLRERGIGRVLLVTSGFHMRRAAAVFRAQGVEVQPVPTDFQRVVSAGGGIGLTPGVNNLLRTTLAFHELAGYQVYRWRGWL